MRAFHPIPKRSSVRLVALSTLVACSSPRPPPVPVPDAPGPSSTTPAPKTTAKTSDAGAPVETKKPAGVRQLAMVTPREGWAIDSRGRVLKTDDGGDHFVALSTQPPLESMKTERVHPYFPIHVAALSARVAWVAERVVDGAPKPGGGPSARVFATTDGGVTWSLALVSSRYGSETYRVDLHPFDERAVWLTIMPDRGTRTNEQLVLKSNDGGQSFDERDVVIGTSDLTLRSSVDAFTTGARSVNSIAPDLLRTKNQAASWTTVPLGFGALTKDESSRLYEPPAFWGARRDDGALLATIWETNATDLVLFTTNDGGTSWQRTKRRRLPHTFCGGSVSEHGSIAIANDFEDKIHVLIGDNKTGAWRETGIHEIEGACSARPHLAYLMSPTDAFLVFDPRGLVRDLAIWSSSDAGKTWTKKSAQIAP